MDLATSRRCSAERDQHATLATNVTVVDSIHDIGGREGFGPVVVEPDEPVIHYAWERRALGMTMNSFVRGLNNGGEFRHGIERMDAVHYLTSRYYEHWLTGVATRYVETGAVTLGELEERAGGRFPLSYAVVPDAAPPPPGKERTLGERVRVRDLETRGHTRCPGYVRGWVGTVVRVDPPSSLPDLEAHSTERRVEEQYSIAFDNGEGVTLHVDLWASYLEDAP